MKKILPPFEASLQYLTIRQRSVKEMTEYLTKKGYLTQDITSTIEKLKVLKFLNDDNFARLFTENRQRKGKSKRAIEFELKIKGLESAQTQEVLEDADSDFKTALRYITKRIHQFDRFTPQEKQKKIISRLRSRGFDWETISKVLKKIDN